MHIHKILAAVACVALTWSTAREARADTVYGTSTTDGSNYAYPTNASGAVNGNTYAIPGVNQGNVCHGLNRDASGNVHGFTTNGVANDTYQTIYMFTGPTCDGFAHTALSGQKVLFSNSTNTSNYVLIKSYYFR